MWRKIKELVLKKPKNAIKNVIFDNKSCDSSIEIAENFNKYFINSIKDIRASIENVQYKNNIPVINHIFRFRTISLSELKTVCKNMILKPDYNKMSRNLIIDNWDRIGKILLNIINKSLESGIFPEKWKESMVTPIEKIQNTRKSDEYRPINSLPICEKILEKVVKNQLEEYFERNNLLTKHQSGFRKRHSCETTINYVINRWKYIGSGAKILAIFLDFKRAFETVDRELLLEKLFKYGIRNNELNWFRTYLTNRRQRTKVNNIKSSELINEYGVPQGSILGALLFLIYINDMQNILENSEIVLYADDTLIFSKDETQEKCYTKLKKDIKNVNLWLKMNKLKLNESKTKIMEINMNTNISFVINNVTIEKVNEIKYLGFVIDKQLKLKEHLEYICGKIGKKIGYFRRLRNKVSIITAIKIYNTIIKPHFEYGSTILYTCCSEQQISRLQKLQNKAMRAILKCNRYTSVNMMLNTLRWLNIRQRLQLNTILFIQKMKRGEAPEYLTDQLRYIADVQPYNLRNAADFRINQAGTTAMQKSLFYKGLSIYNNMPNNIKSIENLNIFRKNVVNFIRYNNFQS